MEYRLEEIFDLQMGKTPSRNNPDYWNSEDNKWISIADLSRCGKYIENTKECLSDSAVEESGISCIPANTVVMSFKLSIGKTAITAEPMYSNEAIMSFRDKKVVDMLPDYIFYMFSGKDWDEGSNKAVMGKTLNKATLSKIKVKIPDIETQKNAVEVLDKVSNIIADRKAELEKLDELIKARFVELFSRFIECAEPVDFESVCEFVTVGIANSATHAFCDKGVIMFRNQNIKEDYLDATDIVHITPEFANKYKTKKLQKDDLLIVRTGYPGVACLVPKRYEGCQTFTTLIARLKNNAAMNPRFVCHYINSEYGKKYVKDNSAGAAQQNFGATALSKLPIYIPPIEKQDEYIRFVEQVDKSKFRGEELNDLR